MSQTWVLVSTKLKTAKFGSFDLDQIYTIHMRRTVTLGQRYLAGQKAWEIGTAGTYIYISGANDRPELVSTFFRDLQHLQRRVSQPSERANVFEHIFLRNLGGEL